MIFHEQGLGRAVEGYAAMTDYFQSLRSFFEVISVRFAMPEYGSCLSPVAGNELFSNANSYLLSDDSSYPYYLWLPTWMGRFYVDPARVPDNTPIDFCPTRDARLLAFVWPWLGFNDAFVDDAAEPECWFGVTEPAPDDDDEVVRTTAASVFNFFRVERTSEGEAGDGWLHGGFRRNAAGCNLDGRWYLRRVPLSQLTSYYAVEQKLIRPLGEKFNELARVEVSPAV
jgi:hypothetical protein